MFKGKNKIGKSFAVILGASMIMSTFSAGAAAPYSRLPFPT